MVDKASRSKPSPSGPSLRERRRQETAELIMDAVLNLIGRHRDRRADDGGGRPSESACRCAPSTATSRTTASLLAAALARRDHGSALRIARRALTRSVPSTARSSPRFDDTPTIVQAVLATAGGGLGAMRRPMRSGSVRSRRRWGRPAIAFPRQEAEQATAVIVYLANALAWLSLRDQPGRPPSGAAITWAIDTLVTDLDRRNQPASGYDCFELRRNASPTPALSVVMRGIGRGPQRHASRDNLPGEHS